MNTDICTASQHDGAAPLMNDVEHGQALDLDNRQWLALAQECVDLYDELDLLSPRLDSQRQEMADHVLHRLRELLERSGLAIISGDTSFDRRRHQADPSSTQAEQGAEISETVSPGFAVDRRVLRRARVRLTGL